MPCKRKCSQFTTAVNSMVILHRVIKSLDMKYYTSDWHLNENRIFDFNPFFRPFKSIEEQNNTIINNVNSIVKKTDTLYHIGDVSMDIDGIKLLSQIKCDNIVLIEGNYDTPFLDELEKYDIEIWKHQVSFINNGDKIQHLFMQHEPIEVLKFLKNNPNNGHFGICGHIHGLWKVQKNMINVSVDAWHFKPVSEKEILFTIEAIKNYYDENVFPS